MALFAAAVHTAFCSTRKAIIKLNFLTEQRAASEIFMGRIKVSLRIGWILYPGTFDLLCHFVYKHRNINSQSLNGIWQDILRENITHQPTWVDSKSGLDVALFWDKAELQKQPQERIHAPQIPIRANH